jgi:two-component sensor histidine kinase
VCWKDRFQQAEDIQDKQQRKMAKEREVLLNEIEHRLPELVK